MDTFVDPALTKPDRAVLDNLTGDIRFRASTAKDEGDKLDYRRGDEETIDILSKINDSSDSKFQATIFTTWDEQDLAPWINQWLVKPYASFASRVVRRPTDIVFLTHILLYLSTSLPSAITLYLSFSWPHAIGHWFLQSYFCGSFTLMMHNHIHNNGILGKQYAWLDQLWPYLLSPLMGHSWNSYYYHHVKHHHVENNGPGDLSSTIRFQRDELFDFTCYVGRFLFLIWFDLPLYFLRKQKKMMALKSAAWEYSFYLCIFALARNNLNATIFVLIAPLIQMRIGMMVGNWGQHALVDEQDPDSDFRSSITLIDVPSNRHCFNDGYHTSHHLNPRRHWRDHPAAFIKAKPQYIEGKALVFKNIDYIFMTVTLLRKDYAKLAQCLVPIGGQIGMSQNEIADMLRMKTKKFSEEDILRKFGRLR